MKKLISVTIIIIATLGIGMIFYFMSKNKSDSLSINENKMPPSAFNQPLPSEKLNPPKDPSSPYIGDDFTIVPPPVWIQTHMQTTLVSFQDPKEIQPEGSTAAKINFKSYIAVSFDNTNKTFEEIVKLVKQQVRSVAPAISFASETSGTIDGQPAKFLEASLNQQDVDFKVLIALVIKDNKYFTISANTTAQKWTEYRDTFYSTVNSFKFKK